VEIELRNILLELDIAKQLMELARQDVELSETMRRAEVRRFEQGASDFFLVNIREETAADARVAFTRPCSGRASPRPTTTPRR
jgi:outer membrane protein TolC